MSDSIASVSGVYASPSLDGANRHIQTTATMAQHVTLHEDQVVTTIGHMSSDEQIKMITDISLRMLQLRKIRIGEKHVSSK